MSTDARFGELLGRLVDLSIHDVCEILEEQGRTRQKFGKIALEWGLCEREHLSEAWSIQLVGRTPRIDLRRLGVEASAVQMLHPRVAIDLGVIPVRAFAGGLVVATSEASIGRAVETLPARTRLQTRIVLADAHQVADAIETYYAHQIDRAHQTACAPRPCGTRCVGEACKRHDLRQAVA